jgi:sodium transport system ATP-binding protein
LIEVSGLCKRFGRIVALDNVSFRAADGQVTGLIGPNGAGKTTTLRILYTVLRPDAGRAAIDGLDTVADRPAVQRRIGVLPDQRGLYPRLTAREHVRYYGRLHGLAGRELDRRIDALFERLEMTALADRRVKGFSKGETLKVALARALVHEPHNVMLDEPTNGLDISASRAVRALIDDMRRAGRCILFSSHIMAEVAALCDRLVVVAHGRIVADGTPAELRAATGFDDLEEIFLSTVAAPA